MQHRFYLCIFLATIFACNSGTTGQSDITQQAVPQVKECPPGVDTVNLVSIFTKDTAKYPSGRFYAIVKFISDKRLFTPSINKAGKLNIEKGTGKTFTATYDSCGMQRWVNKNFIIENIQVTTLSFTGTRKDKFTGFTPGLHFEEWKFANNDDRDSAMKIVQTAYTYPNNIVMYEKRYGQFMIDEKRVYLLETGAKFAERYAIEYKKLIEQFIKTNYNNR